MDFGHVRYPWNGVCLGEALRSAGLVILPKDREAGDGGTCLPIDDGDSGLNQDFSNGL
jgi:hypothetical protein